MIERLKENYQENRESYIKNAQLLGVTIVALLLGFFALVWGPLQENRKLKNDIAQLEAPQAAPPEINADQDTISSLRSAFPAQPSDLRTPINRIAQSSKVKISSYKPEGKTVTIVLIGNLTQLAQFSNSLNQYYQVLNDGQSRGKGPSVIIRRYQLAPVVTRPGVYQVQMNLQSGQKAS